LPWCPAIRREKPGIAHNNASTSRTGGGNRSDLSAHDALFKPVYLIVVRRDDENIIQAQRMRNAVTVNPSGSRPREVLNDGGDAVDLFR
jgi:hypothetical protein